MVDWMGKRMTFNDNIKINVIFLNEEPFFNFNDVLLAVWTLVEGSPELSVPNSAIHMYDSTGEATFISAGDLYTMVRPLEDYEKLSPLCDWAFDVKQTPSAREALSRTITEPIVESIQRIERLFLREQECVSVSNVDWIADVPNINTREKQEEVFKMLIDMSDAMGKPYYHKRYKGVSNFFDMQFDKTVYNLVYNRYKDKLRAKV